MKTADKKVPASSPAQETRSTVMKIVIESIELKDLKDTGKLLTFVIYLWLLIMQVVQK